ncbi:MAG: lipid-A-disaccharide synthase [Rhodocyclaceae bacterium]|nr:lipid-A-disaccharide synthase [Rhodocyclaceae bacterium]
MIRIAMVAGEASGDQLAAHLIVALKRSRPGISFYGIGGPKMEREGFDALWPAEKLSVRGYAEVLRHYREISRIRRQLLKRLLADKPDVFIGVDGSDFNLWLERKLKQAGIPVIHFVSPSIWAWRRNRLKKITQSVDHVLALFPFEPELYANTSVKCTFVGHPMADVISPDIKQKSVRDSLGIPADRQVIALLPGSRQAELRYMAETFIEAAKLLLVRFPKVQFLVPLVSRETRLQFEIALWKCKADELPFTLMFGHATEAIAASDAVLVASGTATLETALVGRPMVIAYKMSPWTYRIMHGMGYLPWVGLPNILARRFVVPEFIQDDATAENLAQAVGNIMIDRPARAAVERVFASLHQALRQNTGEQAAAVVLSCLKPA